ncbi:MAG: peptide/nickel transport system permease protein [Verrucomicrobiales bacterium]|jgi:peptide/nickel transport system permease protein
MTTYLVRRVFAILPVAIIVSFIAFILVQLSPGDPSSFFVGEDATPEQIAEIERQLGIDQPIMVQYTKWAGRAVTGDLGDSFFQRRPVMEAFGEAFPVTAMLAGLSLVIALVIAVPIGMLSVLKQGSISDRISTVLVFIGVSMPNFWLGMLLVLYVSLTFGFFPAQGFDDTNIYTQLKSLFLPALALGYSQAALIARMTRSSMLEVIRSDYVQTARAKGLRSRVVLIKHIFTNAFNPILTVIGIATTSLIAGSVVVETVFNLPGVGDLTVKSISRRDYPMIQGVLLLSSMAIIFVNLIVDILYGALDPRIRYD